MLTKPFARSRHKNAGIESIAPPIAIVIYSFQRSHMAGAMGANVYSIAVPEGDTYNSLGQWAMVSTLEMQMDLDQGHG